MRLFISYARENKAIVNELVEIIQVGGHQAILDVRELIPGRSWQKQLAEEIKQCDALITVLSPDAIASEWCQWEIEEALKLSKPIIPVLVAPNTQIPPKLVDLQYVDFSAGASVLETTRLMRGLQNLAGLSTQTKSAPPTTAPQVVPPPAEVMPFAVSQYLNELDTAYHHAHINEWNVSPTGYIQQVDDTREKVDVDTFVAQWLQNASQRQLAILGDYGSGKSWFCLRLAKQLADEYRANPVENPLPLLVTFRQHIPKMNLIDLIESELFSSYGVKLENPLALQNMLKRGKIFPILDGMDEMAKDLGNYTALVAYTQLDLAAEIPKVIVTCRTHYFYSGSEEREVLNSSSAAALLDKGPRFDILHLKLFDSSQIATGIQRRFAPDESERVLAFIQSTYNLSELCSRPVLLSLVCESHDVLRNLQSPLTSVDLYEAYIGAWLNRELKASRLSIDPGLVYEFFEDLAFDMVRRNSLNIKFDQLRQRFATFLDRLRLPQEQWQEVERQLVTSAFVHRTPGDGWEFVHRSFQEFFYARKFFRWEEQTKGKGDYPVTHIPIWQFIASMALSRWTRAKALEWIKPQVDRRQDPTLTLTTLRAAAAYWLLKKNISATHTYPLTGIMLDSVDLHGLDLVECDLTLSDFHNSDLAATNLTNAKLDETELMGANLENATLVGTSLRFADCRGASFKGANLQHADFSGAQLTQASFVNAKLGGAKLSGASVNFANFEGANFGKRGTPEYKRTIEGLLAARGFHRNFDVNQPEE